MMALFLFPDKSSAEEIPPHIPITLFIQFCALSKNHGFGIVYPYADVMETMKMLHLNLHR